MPYGYESKSIVLDALSPESILKQIKAGLLTCFHCAAFPPTEAVAIENAHSHRETHSYGYSLGFPPMFPFHPLHRPTQRTPLSVCKYKNKRARNIKLA